MRAGLWAAVVAVQVLAGYLLGIGWLDNWVGLVAIPGLLFAGGTVMRSWWAFPALPAGLLAGYFFWTVGDFGWRELAAELWPLSYARFMVLGNVAFRVFWITLWFYPVLGTPAGLGVWLGKWVEGRRDTANPLARIGG